MRITISVTDGLLWLLPMPCLQYNFGNLFIEYGGEASSRNRSINSEGSLLSHQKAKIEVSREKLTSYLNPNTPASSNCQPSDPEEKSHLYLREVRFSDGQVWEAKQTTSK
jgi:hypothetical protein